MGGSHCEWWLGTAAIHPLPTLNRRIKMELKELWASKGGRLFLPSLQEKEKDPVQEPTKTKEQTGAFNYQTDLSE